MHELLAAERVEEIARDHGARVDESILGLLPQSVGLARIVGGVLELETVLDVELIHGSGGDVDSSSGKGVQSHSTQSRIEFGSLKVAS